MGLPASVRPRSARRCGRTPDGTERASSTSCDAPYVKLSGAASVCGRQKRKCESNRLAVDLSTCRPFFQGFNETLSKAWQIETLAHGNLHPWTASATCAPLNYRAMRMHLQWGV